MKRFLSLLTAFALIMTLASCTKNEVPANDVSTTVNTDEFPETDAVTEAISEDLSETPVTEADVSITETNVAEETTANNDPSQWTKEQIIDFYKTAAKKTHPKAKSTQVMVLEELIFNDGDGALAFFVKILEPAIASVIKKNALEFEGITGGFENLTVDDAQNLKAYKSGEYTVIEMTMKPQTDPIHAVATEGSVGHAISVLGDISLVLAEFPQFDVDVENADIDIHYVNPTVKVKINKDGYIEKGTWKYTCDPEIRNLDISGIMIKKADAKIDYIITVGGGY